MFSFSIGIIILHCLHSNFVVWCTLLCIQNTRQLQTHFEVNCWISMKCLEFSSHFYNNIITSDWLISVILLFSFSFAFTVKNVSFFEFSQRQTFEFKRRVYKLLNECCNFYFAISSPNHSIQIDAAFYNCINTQVRPIHLSDTVPNKKQRKTEFVYKKKLLPKKRKKKSNAIWTKIGNILKPNTCYILKSVNSMKLIQIKWTQLVILKGEILFKYLSNQYIYSLCDAGVGDCHIWNIGTGETERITKYYES